MRLASSTRLARISSDGGWRTDAQFVAITDCPAGRPTPDRRATWRGWATPPSGELLRLLIVFEATLRTLRKLEN